MKKPTSKTFYNGLSSVDSAPNGEMSADPDSFSVRVLVPADAAEYHAVRRRALQETPPAFGSLPDDQPDVVETAGALATSEDHHFFGAFHDGRLVGIVRLSHCEARNEKHRAYLAGLYTLPPFRRRGCGRALIRAVLVVRFTNNVAVGLFLFLRSRSC